jgi:hypothetical protein
MKDINKGKFHPGTRFRGNVNNAEFEVMRIENGTTAIIKDVKTGRTHAYGLRALEMCNLEVTGYNPNHAEENA